MIKKGFSACSVGKEFDLNTFDFKKRKLKNEENSFDLNRRRKYLSLYCNSPRLADINKI